MKIEMYKNTEFGRLTYVFAGISLVVLLLTAIFASAKVLIIVLVGFVLIYSSLYIYGRSIYKDMHSLIFGVEKIMRGQYDVNLLEDREGEVSILSFQLNQMAKRLKLSNEEVDKEKCYAKKWISDVSHQLKTPISVLKMFNEIITSEVLENENMNKDVVLDMLYKSSNQIENMEWLVEAILKLSRLESGTIVMNRKSEDINKTVKAASQSLEYEAVNKNQILNLRLNNEPIKFSHDSKWIKEALKNIIKNAIKYTNEDGKIEVEVVKGQGFVKISVSDSGVGIPKEEIPFIFERFYRGKSETEKPSGTGIGLALSKLVVEKHDGIIECQSALGKGTKIIMTFLD